MMQEQQVRKVILCMEMFFPHLQTRKKVEKKFPLRAFFLMNVVVVSSFWDINRAEGLQIICHTIQVSVNVNQSKSTGL